VDVREQACREHQGLVDVLVDRVAIAEDRMAKFEEAMAGCEVLVDQLGIAKRKIAKLEEEIPLIRQRHYELVDGLLRRDQVTREDLVALNKRLNRHRLDIDKNWDQVSLVSGSVFAIPSEYDPP
jgi:chromosome segregation ATPase